MVCALIVHLWCSSWWLRVSTDNYHYQTDLLRYIYMVCSVYGTLYMDCYYLMLTHQDLDSVRPCLASYIICWVCSHLENGYVRESLLELLFLASLALQRGKPEGISLTNLTLEGMSIHLEEEIWWEEWM